MKGKPFSEEQIIGVLKEAEAGQKRRICAGAMRLLSRLFTGGSRSMGAWRLSEVRRLRQLEDENRKLKHVVEELTLDKRAQGSAGKKVLAPRDRREAMKFVVERFDFSERRGCGLIGVGRSSDRYRGQGQEEIELREKLRALAEQRRRFGYRQLYVLLRREGLKINHKRV